MAEVYESTGTALLLLVLNILQLGQYTRRALGIRLFTSLGDWTEDVNTVFASIGISAVSMVVVSLDFLWIGHFSTRGFLSSGLDVGGEDDRGMMRASKTGFWGRGITCIAVCRRNPL